MGGREGGLGKKLRLLTDGVLTLLSRCMVDLKRGWPDGPGW